MLKDKSLTELRGIAQSFDVADIFKKDALQLAQAIEMKQADMQPMPAVVIPKPEYDARLMDKPPMRKADRSILEEYAAPYISRGVSLTFSDEQWFASIGKRNDQGTVRMPPKHFMKALDRLLA